MPRYLKPTLMLAAVIAAIFAVKEFRHHIWWDNFGVVEHDRIYRSGQLQPHQLEEVIRRYGIKTVINTREIEAPLDLMLAEYAVCWREGADMVRLPMPGDGRGDFVRLAQGTAVLADTNRHPVLVHCARGTHRTGALVASYRVLDQGWAPARALQEMEEYRFEGRDHPLVPHLSGFWQQGGDRAQAGRR